MFEDCHGCTERTIRCHSNCTKYIDATKKNEQCKANRQRYTEENSSRAESVARAQKRNRNVNRIFKTHMR